MYFPTRREKFTSTGAITSPHILVAAGATFTDAGTIATGTNFFDNGTTNLTASAVTVSALNGSGALNLNPAMLTITGGGTFSGVIAGSGGITNSGGPLVLSAANTYSGATFANGGTFEIASPGSIASQTVTITTTGNLTVDSGATIAATTNLTDNGTTTFKNATQTIATLSGGGSLILAPTALTITAGGTFSGSLSAGTLTVTGGTLNLSGSVTTPTIAVDPSATLNVSGSLATSTALTSNGQTNFAAGTVSGILVRTIQSLTLSIGGKATILAPSAPTNRTVLITSALTFTNNLGNLDLTANDLIVRGGASTNLLSSLKSGFNAGAGYWNGAGIISSAAANSAGFLTTLGYKIGGSTFDNQSTGASDLLIKYTYYGDADLNGSVNGADYAQIDHGFGSHLTAWSNGDFNYDGLVNGSDYALIDNTFNQLAATGLAPLAVIASPANLIASVPEPRAIGLLAIISLGLLGRRMRMHGPQMPNHTLIQS